MPDDPYGYLAGLSAHPDRAGDTSNFNPQFATALANSIEQARAAGLPVSLNSGFRAPGQTGSAYDAGGNSSHSYGLASDIGGLDGPNGKITSQWAKIATANGLHNPYGIGNKAEFNHWQLPEQPLEQTPQLLNSLKSAASTGNFQNVWNAYGAPTPPTQVASAAAANSAPLPPPNPFAGLNPAARGVRNNNPGNLVANNWTAGLPGYKGSDGRFAIFDTPQNGAAALDHNLSSYGSKGINTPLAIASTWAPASDGNNPTSYGGQIAKALGVAPTAQIDMKDPSVRQTIGRAIGVVENGPAPGTTLNTPPPPAAPTTPAAPATPQSILGKLAAGTGTDGKGPSAIQSLATAVGGGGGQSSPDEAPRQQQMLPVNNQQQQMLSTQGQQLAAQIQARAAAPLTWNSKTPGAGLQTGAMTPVNIGGQIIPMPPGMTLNSMGNSYG